MNSRNIHLFKNNKINPVFTKFFIFFVLLCLVINSYQTLCNSMQLLLQPARFLCPWDSPGKKKHWSGLPCPSLGDLPSPWMEPRSPTLQADSLLSESPRKPKNTGVGILSLLQQIFLTHNSNQGFLHCRRIRYQLSYQGSLSLWEDFLIASSVYFLLESVLVICVFQGIS